MRERAVVKHNCNLFFLFPNKYILVRLHLLVVVSNVLYELLNIHHAVSDIRRAGVAHGGHYQALVKPQMVDRAEG